MMTAPIISFHTKDITCIISPGFIAVSGGIGPMVFYYTYTEVLHINVLFVDGTTYMDIITSLNDVNTCNQCPVHTKGINISPE